MNIKDVRNYANKYFKELEEGDIFQHAGIYYMKTEEVLLLDGITYNAVNLENGVFVRMYEDDRVARLVATLEILRTAN